ncbi:MAG: glycosyltransferase family 4 protein [Bryobacterales bacterium]|nr:glycosyltransferase family 4 protein [Bryobacterales bacterium]
MKAALDRTPLTVATGGIRRYTEELHRALMAAFPEDEFALLGQRGCSRWRSRWWSRWWSPWWSMGLPWTLVRERFDLFHGTDFAVPYLPVRPAVMTLHDLSPWRGFPASDRVRRRTPWLLRMRLATMIITPTEAVRREAIEMFRLPGSIVVTVPEAAGAEFHPVEQRTSGPGYFLMVGTAGPRKNMHVVLEAFRELRRENQKVELWIAGRGEHGPPEPGVRVLGMVRDEELPGLYQQARALLFPSLYEGFGLPLLEAMQCGTPVVASQDPALVEVSGGAALHADARDTRAWLEAMRELLASGGVRQREAGLRRASGLSWQRTARMTRDVYLEACARYG